MKMSRIQRRTAWFVSAIALLLQISPSLASGPSPEGRPRRVNEEITFIKWISTYPDLDMAGFVGGDATGPFAGKVLSLTPISADEVEIEATYEAGSGEDAFVAHIKGKQNNQSQTASLNGFVTKGRLKGARVHVEYNVIVACGQAGAVINGECYMGTIRIFGRVPR